MLQSCIQAFRVLTNNNQVKLWITARHVWQCANRPQIRVKIERLTQSDVDRREALADWSSNRSFKCDLVTQDRVEQFLWQSFAEFLECLGPCVMGFPLNFDACSFDD